MKRKVITTVGALLIGGGLIQVPLICPSQTVYSQEVEAEIDYRQTVLDILEARIAEDGLQDQTNAEDILTSLEGLVIDDVEYENEDYHVKSEFLPEGLTLTGNEQLYLTEYLYNFGVSQESSEEITEESVDETSMAPIDDEEIGQSYQEVIDGYLAAVNGEEVELRGGQLNYDLINYYLSNGYIISYAFYDVDYDGVRELLILANELVIDLYTESEGVAIQYLPMADAEVASEIIILKNSRVILNDTANGQRGDFFVYDFLSDSFGLSQVAQYQYNFSEELDQPVNNYEEDEHLTYDEFVEVVGYNEKEILNSVDLEVIQLFNPNQESDSISTHEYAVDYESLDGEMRFGLNGIGHPHTLDFYPEQEQLVFNYPHFDGTVGSNSIYNIEYNLIDDLVIQVFPSDLSRNIKEVTVNSELFLVSQRAGDEIDYLEKPAYIYYNNEGSISIAIPYIVEDGSYEGYYYEYSLLDD